MASLAEFETAPTGTVYRSSQEGGWTDASVGDKLYEGFESNNTQGNNYRVKLFSNAEIFLNSTTTVYINNLSGVVKYRESGGGWAEVGDPGSYEVMAVATRDQSSVSLGLLARGGYRPPAWD
ncbi:hypothetical protein CEE37_12325 [candidate division LCP-89 bacterium B3_LCP]|uniref:Uncharacterized protein n=1 Tax=candidate division LCP-89 bacterium B3_LCP TaxID=2012998 RepID=A0A532UUC3_UNCL8|nr:MAG: hypothetical protein CEE37_12325 [candidate division LCP-89 bacterium B3_LCP]